MYYCGEYNFTDIWVDNGINRCFYETVWSIVLVAFMTIVGSGQLATYAKYGRKIDPNFKPSAVGMVIQITIVVILMNEVMVHVILHDTTIGTRDLSGSHVVVLFSMFYVWSFSMRLLLLERNETLPRFVRGHGFALLVFWVLVFIKESLYFISWNSKIYWWNEDTVSKRVEFGLWLIRYIGIISLLILGFWAPSLPRSCAHLTTRIRKEPKSSRKESTWSGLKENIRMMIPIVWPKGSFWRQFLVFVCFIILVSGRVVNLFVPEYTKLIVDSLTPTKTESGELVPPVFRWDLILLYCLLLFMRGGGTGTTGFLNNLRAFLWIPIQQYTTRRIQLKFLRHLHSLSLRWHLERKTGEVLRTIDRGTTSINSLLGYILFNIFPTIVDVILAIMYFVLAFNYIFGIITFMCMLFYLGITILITEWRTKYRRLQNRLDNQRNQTAVDSLLNFETVKYYAASEFEIGRYDKAIHSFQLAEFKSTASLNLLSCLQNITITVGFCVGSLLCAYCVVDDIDGLKLTVGDYILFGTYITQLYGPLNWIGTYYRMIQQAFIDMENMFELLQEKPEINDLMGAPGLALHGGQIEFKDVSFSYTKERPILKNLSFTVPAGQTFALVGHSGSGKSTIVRLLFRFYDIQGGAILIDGQDISQVTQNSLQKQIGVVPQDTVLFNQDIRYNIRYGNQEAHDVDVLEAAEAADIHNRILSFPEGYDTVVGERGLKLSGGEKQRVAIARTILKNPTIVLLDEATSALDTSTERYIQASLEEICRNRTTIIVAHRLSTIIHAHQILVMKEGEIVEKGTHNELLLHGGFYKEMWKQQLQHNTDKDNGALSSTSSTGSADDGAS